MTGHTFDKRFYTPRAFLRDAAYLALHLPDMVSAIIGKRVSRAFAEKVMLAVTEVNSCRYCSYVHTRMALRHGVSARDIQELTGWGIAAPAAPTYERVALAFARHFAETEGHSDPQAVRRLRTYYGPAVSRDVLCYIRLITVGNLAGNSVDAFLSRLFGKPARASNPVSELVMFLLFAPFTLPLLRLMKSSEFATQSAIDLHDFSIRRR
ncbi:MAG: carboxymuconolactone decarboxylase family protein [Chloroflexota bacterium]